MDYITQVSEEIEGRVTKKLSQEFGRTEIRILGALSKLDEFLRNPQARVHSGPVPETFRTSNAENHETNEDRSQNDLHPKVGVSLTHFYQEFGPRETFYRDPKVFVTNLGLTIYCKFKNMEVYSRF